MSRPSSSPARPAGRRRALLSAVLGLGLSAVVLGLGSADAVTSSDPADALPASADSTAVARQQADLPAPPELPAIAVFSRVDGGSLTGADLAAVQDRAASLPDAAPPASAPDGTVATVSVPLSTALDDEQVVEQVGELRATARDDLPADLQGAGHRRAGVHRRPRVGVRGRR